MGGHVVTFTQTQLLEKSCVQVMCKAGKLSYTYDQIQTTFLMFRLAGY
jgi:hypothetical protein